MKKAIMTGLMVISSLVSVSAHASTACEEISRKAFVGFTADVFNDFYQHFMLTTYNGVKPEPSSYVPVAAESPDTTLDKSDYEITSKIAVQLGSAHGHTDSNGNTVADTSDGWYLTFKCKNP
jgi:hypothetical protein